MEEIVLTEVTGVGLAQVQGLSWHEIAAANCEALAEVAGVIQRTPWIDFLKPGGRIDVSLTFEQVEAVRRAVGLAEVAKEGR